MASNCNGINSYYTEREGGVGGQTDLLVFVHKYLDVSVPATIPLRRDKVVLSKP